MGAAGGDGGMASFEMMVPDKMVGLIIGRGGQQITRLQAETGCKIHIVPDNQGLPERVCTLTGSNDAIQDARNAIEQIISNRGSGPPQRGGFGGGPPGGGHSFEMMIPSHKVGLIIGKGGETIKQLQEQTGCKMVIIQDTMDGANEKPLRITGAPDNVEQAKMAVTDVLSRGRDDGGFGGGRGGGRGRGGYGGGRGGYGGGGRSGGGDNWGTYNSQPY